jgi:hypothetical protein
LAGDGAVVSAHELIGALGNNGGSVFFASGVSMEKQGMKAAAA